MKKLVLLAALCVAAGLNAKQLLAIGDSITAAMKWQKRAGEVLGMDVKSHCRGGIGIVAMADGRKSDMFPVLTADDVKDADVIVLMGFYNERGMVWQPATRGKAATDMYPQQKTFCGKLNYLIKRVREEMAKAGNTKAQLFLVAPHCYGKYPWINQDAYYDGEKMLSAVQEVADFHKIPCIDLFHKGGIDRTNWNKYQASASPIAQNYLPADGSAPAGVNKPFATLAAAPDAAQNNGKTITVTGVRGCYRSNGKEWVANPMPFPWIGDQLHMNKDGYYKIGEVIANEIKKHLK